MHSQYHMSCIMHHASCCGGVIVVRLHEVVQHDVLVRVVYFSGHFCRFVYVAQHIGRRIGPHLDQSMIVKIFAYLHNGLAPQCTVFFLNATARVAVFYKNSNHIAPRRFAELIFFGYGLFYFVFYFSGFRFLWLQGIYLCL